MVSFCLFTEMKKCNSIFICHRSISWKVFVVNISHFLKAEYSMIGTSFPLIDNADILTYNYIDCVYIKCTLKVWKIWFDVRLEVFVWWRLVLEFEIKISVWLSFMNYFWYQICLCILASSVIRCYMIFIQTAGHNNHGSMVFLLVLWMFPKIEYLDTKHIKSLMIFKCLWKFPLIHQNFYLIELLQTERTNEMLGMKFPEHRSDASTYK